MLSPLNAQIVKVVAEQDATSLLDIKAKISPEEAGLSDSYNIAELLRLNLKGLYSRSLIWAKIN
jgi:hypothetical protein